MPADITFNKGRKRSMPSILSEGPLRFTTDSGECFLDLNNNIRIKISDIVTIDSTAILDLIDNPFDNLFFYVEETNTFYKWNKTKNQFKPVGSGVFAISEDVEGGSFWPSEMSLTFSGDMTGSGSFDGTQSTNIDMTLKEQQVVPGQYGEIDDKENTNSGDIIKIPWFTVQKNGLITSAGSIDVRLPISVGSIVAAGSNVDSNPAISADNGGVFLNLVADDRVISSVPIIGDGSTAVKITNGKIVVHSTASQTLESGTGIKIEGTHINHTNMITAGKTEPADESYSFLTGQNILTIPCIFFDANGHINYIENIKTVLNPYTETRYEHDSSNYIANTEFVTREDNILREDLENQIKEVSILLNSLSETLMIMIKESASTLTAMGAALNKRDDILQGNIDSLQEIVNDNETDIENKVSNINDNIDSLQEIVNDNETDIEDKMTNLSNRVGDLEDHSIYIQNSEPSGDTLESGHIWIDTSNMENAIIE